MDASELNSTQYLLSVLHNIECIFVTFRSAYSSSVFIYDKNSVEAGQDIQIWNNINYSWDKIPEQ